MRRWHQAPTGWRQLTRLIRLVGVYHNVNVAPEGTSVRLTPISPKMGRLRIPERAPKGEFPKWQGRQRIYFGRFTVGFDYGGGLGHRPFEILPWFLEGKDHEWAFLFFVATEARKGRVRIGSKHYDTLLCQPYCIGGRYDHPWTTLFLTPPGSDAMYTGFCGEERLGCVNGEDPFTTPSSL